MLISTSRFGKIQINEEDKIVFREGLLGFNHLRSFVLLDDPTDEIFAWLQSCEEPAIAFPVLEPELFADPYNVKLPKADQVALELSAENPAPRFFTIVTIPQDPTQMTANLKAPVAINVHKRLARQCVLQDNNLAIKEPIFTHLQKRVISSPAGQLKPPITDCGVAIRLHEPGGEPEVSV